MTWNFKVAKLLLKKLKHHQGLYLLNELSTSAVANDQQNMNKMPPTINDVRSRLTTVPTEEQSQFRTLTVHIPM